MIAYVGHEEGPILNRSWVSTVISSAASVSTWV